MHAFPSLHGFDLCISRKSEYLSCDVPVQCCQCCGLAWLPAFARAFDVSVLCIVSVRTFMCHYVCHVLFLCFVCFYLFKQSGIGLPKVLLHHI